MQQDRVWYGRAAVWMGVGLLFLMAIMGRPVTVVIVAAVISTIVGIVLLIFSIPVGSSSSAPSDQSLPERKATSRDHIPPV